MSIRTKLIGAFLLVALLVPILGGVAVSRVRSIDSDVDNLSRDAIPTLLKVKELNELQREQQAAVLAYLTSGKKEDRQRYLELSQKFEEQLAGLTASLTEGQAGSARSAELAQQVADERTKFGAAAGQMLGSRATVERNLTDLRTKNQEIVEELTSIRRRFASGSAGTENPAGIPQSLRYQVNDLLLGTEGMLKVVGLEFALATGYTITPDDAARQQFESSGAAFNNWLQLANAAGGPDDRAILSRVQNKFFKEFEPSARSMMLAADFATKARTVFAEASTGITQLLNRMVEQESVKMTAARGNAEATANSTGGLMVVITLIAFVVAGALGLWFAGTITRPLVHLRNVADRISRGEVDNVDISVGTRDEIADLAVAFRRMLVSVRFLMARSTEDDEEFDVAGVS